LDLTRLGSLMLEWTKAKGDRARCMIVLGKDLLMCFPNWHDLQDKLDKLDKLGTRCCILAKLQWPNWAWIKDRESISVPTYAEVHRW